VKRNRRIGTGITGCLQSPLFNPDTLDRAYAAIQKENRDYSKELNIPESIRTTVIKPSGTISKVMDCYEGVHPAYSRYIIQRVRFAGNDALLPLLREAGHYMEPTVRFDGTLDHNTQVVDFYVPAPDNAPVADEDWTTWKQLDVVKMAQKHWADQAVSVTVYYRQSELDDLKAWLKDNLKYLKTISFLCHSEHGFKQAPKEKITKEQYEKLSAKIKPINIDNKDVGQSDLLSSMECVDGACPVK
jgi:ribonucleoside-triphosphate reductase